MADYVDEAGIEYNWDSYTAPVDTRATDGVVNDASSSPLVDYRNPTASSGSDNSAIYARAAAQIATSASNVALMRWLGGSAPTRSPMAGGVTGTPVAVSRGLSLGGSNLAPLLLLGLGVYFLVSHK